MSHGGFSARMLSLLILDLKKVDAAYIEKLIANLESAEAGNSRSFWTG